jgi:hypothetical protein
MANRRKYEDIKYMEALFWLLLFHTNEPFHVGVGCTIPRVEGKKNNLFNRMTEKLAQLVGFGEGNAASASSKLSRISTAL